MKMESCGEDAVSLLQSEGDPCVGYTSCVRVNGRPILPPVMTEAKRQEMRHLKAMAMRREEERRRGRGPNPTSQPTVDVVDNSASSGHDVNVSSSKDTIVQCHSNTPQQQQEVSFTFVPVPAVRKKKYFEDVPSAIGCSAIQDQPQTAPESVPETAPESVPETVPQTAPESVPQTAPEPDEEHEDDDDTYSQTSFESATSVLSSATFVIETSQSYAALNHSCISDGELVDFDEDELDDAVSLGVRRLKISSEQRHSPTDNTENIPPSSKGNSITSLLANTTAQSKPPSKSIFDSIGLSRLKSQMRLMSPSIFKRLPRDTRSPLLKGVVFMDPLSRPRAIKRIPPKALDPAMKPKFDRVTAGVKGYLTRRLLKTKKVSVLLQTIQESVVLILNLYVEGSRMVGSELPHVSTADAELHDRLVQQLNGACTGVREIFSHLSIKERMAIISTDRNLERNKVLREMEMKASGRKNISIATLRSMQRRQTLTKSDSGTPLKRKKHKSEKENRPLQVPSHVVRPAPGRLTVKNEKKRVLRGH